MNDIVTEHAGSILRVQFNRPTKRNAMTSAMYLALAGIFSEAAKDQNTRVVLWHGAGDSFCAGNDIEDFLKNPPGPGESPQAKLMAALVDFDKTDRRRGPRRRDRWRHHHARALRLHLRGR
jgi:enoyl-CoA hydratase/carnithine racemase